MAALLARAPFPGGLDCTLSRLNREPTHNLPVVDACIHFGLFHSFRMHRKRIVLSLKLSLFPSRSLPGVSAASGEKNHADAGWGTVSTGGGHSIAAVCAAAPREEFPATSCVARRTDPCGHTSNALLACFCRQGNELGTHEMRAQFRHLHCLPTLFYQLEAVNLGDLLRL